MFSATPVSKSGCCVRQMFNIQLIVTTGCCYVLQLFCVSKVSKASLSTVTAPEVITIEEVEFEPVGTAQNNSQDIASAICVSTGNDVSDIAPSHQQGIGLNLQNPRIRLVSPDRLLAHTHQHNEAVRVYPL